MNVERLAIPDLILLTPRRYADPRGYFSETFHIGRFAEAGVAGPFVQDNQSHSVQAGTIRGLHCQVAPSVQGKLVRCLRGAIPDIAVDIRHGSPHFGRHVAVELSAENGSQLWIPGGFLHGFCTLAPATDVLYKVTAGYDPAAERGVIWNDPDLALPWPSAAGPPVLSDKDARLPPLSTAGIWFRV
ncbi:MAG: dTDP-4-dehydrorhamnose 3,5-epimerase [Alphaproteobacteria bacterium]|nr:dTDP-4-dehydrorhamnose 3,5-epimerase [Alphaproteobacteria bacterium]